MRRRDKVTWAEPALLILGALASAPRHGYAIAAEVRDHSGIDLGPGTLYGALARLEQAGLIEALEGDERRRPYRITAEGRAVLAERLAAMRRFVDHGFAALALGEAAS